MKNKSSASYYKAQCDKHMGAFIRSRGECQKCGKKESLQWAHIIPRTNHTLRWDPLNALCLCYRCHIHWQHHDPLAFSAWLHEKMPEVAEYLETTKGLILKRSAEDYKELLETIKKAETGDYEAAMSLIVGNREL